MDPLSPVPAIGAVLTAFFTSLLLVRKFGGPPLQGRFSSIDGLRGYLAFFVFLHHSAIWYFYLRTGTWEAPPSNLYNHFGQTAVALFFMITGLLFFSKLIGSRNNYIEWEKLFISRFFRLVPLYTFSMLLVFLVIAHISNGIATEPPSKLIEEAIRWILLMTVDINGVKNSNIIIAKVVWSLHYEWAFYFSLPIFALLVGVKVPIKYIAIGIACMTAMAIWHLQVQYFLSFIGGIAASLLVRSSKFRLFSAGNIASVIVIGCIGTTVIASPTVNSVAPLILLSLAFSIIASGNNLFGLLVSPTSRFLGEFSYSIYLLHGIVLFVIFRIVIGFSKSQALSPIAHWLIVIGITPFLISICFLTYRFIERPAMKSAKGFSDWRRSGATAKGHTSSIAP